MAEYMIQYNGTKADRLAKIAKQEGLGRQMLHDDFHEDGWVMTFIDPIPPTPEEIAERLADEAEEKVFAKVEELIDKIDSLPKAREFLKRLCKRLVSKGCLP